MWPVPDDWHERFFEGLWLDVQPHSFSREESRADVDAVQEILQLMPGAKVLDVPCGDGRIAIEMAKRGFAVTGVERSPALLERARSMAEAMHVRLDLREGDMWALELEGRFDAVTCLWHSFGYGSEEQDLAFFSGVAERLAPAGALALEGHVAETLLPHWEERAWRQAANVVVAEERSFDPERSRVLTRWILSREGTVEERFSSIRIYGLRELLEMLRRAGFARFETYGSMSLEPFELGASQLVLCARKSGGEDDRRS